MAGLSLALLGPLQVLLDGAPITAFESDKVRALLAYLAIEAGRPHRRDALAGLLWPDRPERAAHLNLNQALANLRGAIGDRTAIPSFLYITRETVQFNRASDYELDVETFHAHLANCDQHRHRHPETCKSCVQRLRQAADLYRGSFLAQFFLSDSAAFEEWALLKREWLHRRALRTLARLADYHERRGEYEQAQHDTWRQLELDAWREESHRQLMRVLTLSGQRSAALEQYERCRRALADELGVEPEEETTALYERICDTASAELSAQRAEAQHVRNFPAQTSLLIGRETELAELGALLENPACRLITVVGPGGIGKTRLALAVAADQAEAFVDGAAFVPLQAISAAAFMAPTILSALDIPLQNQRDPRDQLLNYLRGKELLLVLDNFEQLLMPDQGESEGGAALLTNILNNVPGVTLLVTSRERLALSGEWLFDVSGLNYPPSKLIEGIEGYSAVQLFVQRAGQVRRQFRFTDGEARVVARICQLVEGMPLAIELAAAALRSRSCKGIADSIESSLSVLATGPRAVPERHRSMWATFEHSWRLLSDEEQHVFPRLSVFRGGFQEEAATQVAKASAQLLTALVDKSFLRWDGVARYDMHELVRQYASEKLEQAGEGTDTRNQHAAYYLMLAEMAEPALQGAQKGTWLNQLETELNNVRATLEWALDGGEAETGLWLVGALWLFWDRQRGSDLTEGQAWFEKLIAAGRTASTAARAKALYRAAWLAMSQWDFKRAAALSQESLALCRELGDKRGMAWSLFHLGDAANSFGNHAMAYSLKQESMALFREVGERWGLAYMLTNQGHEAMMLNDYASMRSRLEESMAIWQELGDQVGIGQTLCTLGEAAIDQGDYRSAAARLEQSLELHRELEDKWSVATVLGKLGSVAWCQGDFAAARSRHEESLTLYREVGSKGGSAITLGNLGLLAQNQGEPAQAIALCEESLELWRELDDVWGIAWSLNILGHVVQRQGDDQRASALLMESLPLAWQRENRAGVAWCLEGLASVAWTQGQPRRAARLFGAAEALRQTIGVPLPPVEHANYESDMARVCAHLGEMTFAAAWDEGRVMSLEQTIASALSEADPTAETQADAR